MPSSIVAALQTRPVLRAQLQTDAHPHHPSSQCRPPSVWTPALLDTRDGFHGIDGCDSALLQPCCLVSHLHHPGLISTALLRLFVPPAGRDVA
ncbi:hypothetical protein GQ607_007216 [Colletotrichum asianum]|uniref:Uncharacterized protein n=1 Tax=Colletotrichum asianum TaxID=702518 RepID=A0A8H3ZVL9_9PEZI|nr:hypothetical protein GQ607_007216 [Colletotrichum asianum]